jgi:hypothetical protein
MCEVDTFTRSCVSKMYKLQHVDGKLAHNPAGAGLKTPQAAMRHTALSVNCRLYKRGKSAQLAKPCNCKVCGKKNYVKGNMSAGDQKKGAHINPQLVGPSTTQPSRMHSLTYSIRKHHRHDQGGVLSKAV